MLKLRNLLALAAVLTSVNAQAFHAGHRSAHKTTKQPADYYPSRGMRYLTPNIYPAIRAAIPMFPQNGTPEFQADVNELMQLQQTRTPQDCQRANSEVSISVTSFYGAPYGPLSAQQVLRVTPIVQQVRYDLEYFVAHLKSDFHRPRPYLYISGLKPCVPLESSFAYPSGHATTAVLTSLVLSEIYPQLAKVLDQRSYQIALDRVLGGVHHPSDIYEGHVLAQTLFAEMKKSPSFMSDLQALKARARVKSDGERDRASERISGVNQ